MHRTEAFRRYDSLSDQNFRDGIQKTEINHSKSHHITYGAIPQLEDLMGAKAAKETGFDQPTKQVEESAPDAPA
jgi:hypothetical protein